VSTALDSRAEAGVRAGGGWGLPLVVLVAGMFMSVLDTSIVNVAIPEMQNVFGVTADDIEKIATAMGLYGLGIIVAPAIGPTLGGYLVEYVDWRLIFLINVPVGVLGAIAAWFLLPNFAAQPAGRFDVLGFATIATGLSALLLALSEGQSWGWTSYPVVILIILGVLSLVLFVVIELEVQNPLLDVRVFRSWPYTNSLLLISVLSVGLFATLFYVPVYLQQAQGLGAFEAGLILMPQALVMAVFMPLAGRVYDRIGARWPAVIGLLIVAYATYLMRDLTVATSQGEIIGLLCLRAAGMGMSMMPIMTGGIAAVTAELVGTASAFNNVVQRVSAALGLAVLTAFMSSNQAQLSADRAGLISPDASMPSLAAGPAGEMAGTMTVYQQTQTQVFVSSLDNVMLIITYLSLLGVVLALFLRSGRSAPAGAGAGADAVH
jgi:EmrB/QacA subfamily drug resistance transporter